MSQLPTPKAPAAGSCVRALGGHGGQLLRHLGDCQFQLVEAVTSRAMDMISTAIDIYLTHQVSRFLEDQAKLPGLGNSLIIGLLWEYLQLERDHCEVSCEAEAQFILSDISGKIWTGLVQELL